MCREAGNSGGSGALWSVGRCDRSMRAEELPEDDAGKWQKEGSFVGSLGQIRVTEVVAAEEKLDAKTGMRQRGAAQFFDSLLESMTSAGRN